MDQRLVGRRVVSSYEQIAGTRLINIIVETKEDYVSLVSEFMAYCMVKRLDGKDRCNVTAWIREYNSKKSIEESYDKLSNRLKPEYYVYFSKEDNSMYQGIGFPTETDTALVIYKRNPYTVDLV